MYKGAFNLYFNVGSLLEMQHWAGSKGCCRKTLVEKFTLIPSAAAPTSAMPHKSTKLLCWDPPHPAPPTGMLPMLRGFFPTTDTAHPTTPASCSRSLIPLKQHKLHREHGRSSSNLPVICHDSSDLGLNAAVCMRRVKFLVSLLPV